MYFLSFIDKNYVLVYQTLFFDTEKRQNASKALK